MKSITFVVVMQRLVASILVMAVLVALATGCGRARYDARLVQADSLMWTAPDSALATLAAIDSLAGEANQAYRDLLMTQARYKCYADITASDDSAITRAMDYYRAHSGQREKVTRACLYKGAVMEELGHVDSAMYYYKTAEAAADPTDYLNLGQINTRIADLYRLYYADSQTCYDKFEQALRYYKLTGNKRLQFDCLFNMGGCSGVTRIGNPEKLLAQAAQLAIELNDSSKFYKCQELLCRQLTFKGDSLNRAKQLALYCLNNYRAYVTPELILDLAEIYAKSGMADSARYYIDLVNEIVAANNSEQIQTRRYLILSEIARAEGDLSSFRRYDMLSHQISDSILNSKQRFQIQQIENSFNSQKRTGFASQISRLHWIILGLSVSAILVILLLVIEHIRRRQRTKAIINGIQEINSSHLDRLLAQFDAKNTATGHLVSNLLIILKTCVAQRSDQLPTSKLAQQIKETIVDIADDDFWNELRAYLDRNHNGIMSAIAEQPGISTKDMKFIELLCCGFSSPEISLILGYAPKYVFNKRKIIANKLGIDIPLQDYLDSLLRHNEP